MSHSQNELKSSFNPVSTWLDDVGLNTEATRELQELLGTNISIYPKPVSLIEKIISTSVSQDDIILDFFAGSGTTGQATLEKNNMDGGRRKFILVQIPEPTERKEFLTIAEITKERVRRVIKKLKAGNSDQLQLDRSSTKQDLGFKVFKLQSSNFKIWDAGSPENAEKLGKQLEMHVDHIVKERSQDDILYELLLKTGFPLTTKIESLTLAGKKVHSVQDGALFICLEKKLTLEAIRIMADKKPARVVCLDEGFERNDQLKTNAVQTFKSKNITFRTV